METLVASQLQQFAAVGSQTFTGLLLLFLTGLFVFLVLVLCKKAHALYRVLRLLRDSFSEAAMQSSPLLHRYWSEYSHTFMPDLRENNKTLHDANRFFDPERVVGEVLDLRWWRFAPNVFFVFGMLAVLGQLIYGLVFFDMSSQEAIMDSVKHAFLAVANGFVALMAGLGFSLAMYFSVRWVYGALARRVHDLATYLNGRYLISTLEERELTLAEYAKTLTRIVNTLFAGSQGGKGLTPGLLSKAMLEQMRQTNRILEQKAAPLDSEAIEHLGRAAGQTMAEELRPLLTELRETLRTSPLANVDGNEAPRLASSLLVSTQVLQEYLRRQKEGQEHDFEESLNKSQGPKQ